MPYLYSLRLRSLIISNIELVTVTDTLDAYVASIVRARKEQIPVQSQDNGNGAVLVGAGAELAIVKPIMNGNGEAVLVAGAELAIVNSDGELVTGK